MVRSNLPNISESGNPLGLRGILNELEFGKVSIFQNGEENHSESNESRDIDFDLSSDDESCAFGQESAEHPHSHTKCECHKLRREERGQEGAWKPMRIWPWRSSRGAPRIARLRRASVRGATGAQRIPYYSRAKEELLSLQTLNLSDEMFPDISFWRR